MDAISHGIGYLPEDRLRQGLFLPMSINDNITITIVDQLSRRGWLNPPKEQGNIDEDVEPSENQSS